MDNSCGADLGVLSEFVESTCVCVCGGGTIVGELTENFWVKSGTFSGALSSMCYMCTMDLYQRGLLATPVPHLQFFSAPRLSFQFVSLYLSSVIVC